METTLKRESSVLRLLGDSPEKVQETLKSIRNCRDQKALERLLDNVPIGSVYKAVVMNYYSTQPVLEKAFVKITSPDFNISDKSKWNLLMNISINPGASKELSRAAKEVAYALPVEKNRHQNTNLFGGLFGFLRQSPVQQTVVSACGD